MRTEPPVSEPMATGASPWVIEAAAPEDEPPGTWPGISRLGGVAVFGLMPRPEKANSV